MRLNFVGIAQGWTYELPFVTTITKLDFLNGAEADPKQFALSQSVIKSIFSIISSFYGFLIQESLVEANPVSLIKQKSKFLVNEQDKPIIRRISNLQWDYVLETAELMADANPEEFERTLFIMNCLIAMYLRVSELVADERSTTLMTNFNRDK